MEGLVGAPIGGSARTRNTIDHIMLASPDIDIDLFRTQLAQLPPPVISKIYLLVSTDDAALRFSRRIAGGVPRVGAADTAELERLGVTVIDLSQISNSSSGSHYSRDYQIMTNSPTFDQQLALDAYWKKVGGDVMLPGTNRAADRFVRASYYINEATQTADPRRAVAAVFSVMRNVSVPLGIKVPGQPNIADTLRLTVSDQKNRVYFYQDTNSPGILWANLGAMDFSEGSGARRLQMDGNPDIAGDQTANFQPAEPFKFLSQDAPH